MRHWVALLTFAAIMPLAHGQDMFIYPAQGQDRDQQDMDEFQCQRFGTEQSGFDPMRTPTATSARPQQQGGAVGGAARGALLGTAVGAIAGDTRRGAAMGAASGGLMGGMRRRDSNRQQDQWAQQETANYQQQRNQFNRAFAACLEGRGYTVR